MSQVYHEACKNKCGGIVCIEDMTANGGLGLCKRCIGKLHAAEFHKRFDIVKPIIVDETSPLRKGGY